MSDASQDEGDTYVNPLADAFGAQPVDPLGPGEPQARGSDPEDSARLVVSVANFACTMKWEKPLEDQESAELQADLAKVLAKYDVPNLPYQEEANLVMTTAKIVGRRVIASKQEAAARAELPGNAPAQAPKSQGVAYVNHAVPRQEGQREIRSASQDMFSRVGSEGRAVFP